MKALKLRGLFIQKKEMWQRDCDATPDSLEEGDDVEEELFGQFLLPSDHESLHESSSLFDELKDRLLRQVHRVTDVYRSDVVQLAALDQLT